MGQRWWVVGVVAVVALAVGAMAGERLVSSGPESASSPSPSGASEPSGSATPARRPPGFAEFRDRRAGFSISYPAKWERLDSRDPDVRLLAATRDGALSLLVRASPIGSDLPPGKLPAREGLTREILASGEDVKLLTQPRQARLGGLPGFSYIYTFRDAASGGRGLHSHYFLFGEGTRISLVLQAIPGKRHGLRRSTALLDQIANTFRARA